MSLFSCLIVDFKHVYFLIGIHSMQAWTATTRYGVTRKRRIKRLKHTGNLFRKNLQLQLRYLLILDLKPFRSQRRASYRQKIPESVRGKKTVDIDILVTSRNGDRKTMQSIRITSRPPSRKRKLHSRVFETCSKLAVTTSDRKRWTPFWCPNKFLP